VASVSRDLSVIPGESQQS